MVHSISRCYDRQNYHKEKREDISLSLMTKERIPTENAKEPSGNKNNTQPKYECGPT